MELADITSFVQRHGKPAVASLSEDTHIFHFDPDGYWQDSPVVLVNRNGNQFRLFRKPIDWLFAKTWAKFAECDDWHIAADLRRPDPVQLIQLAGAGPQSSRPSAFESLCLLPREVTTGRRKAVWRSHIIDTGFDRANNTFTLYPPSGGAPYIERGKLWESQAAADWCREAFAAVEAPIVETKVRKAFGDEQLAALEDNALWGMF